MSGATPPPVDPAFAAQAREEWGLTPREIEVAWLTALGVTRREDIARRLGLSYHTVKNYRTIIRQKMAVDPWIDYTGNLLAVRARNVYERTAQTVALAALADDFAALERLIRGVMTYLELEAA